MKRHLLSLFDARHLKRTILLFSIAMVLIIYSLLAGMDKDWSVMASLLGMIFLFFAVLHPWRKASSFGWLALACVGFIIILVILITVLDKMQKSEIINDNIVEGFLFFVCIPGILVSIIGAILCAAGKSR